MSRHGVGETLTGEEDMFTQETHWDVVTGPALFGGEWLCEVRRADNGRAVRKFRAVTERKAHAQGQAWASARETARKARERARASA